MIRFFSQSFFSWTLIALLILSACSADEEEKEKLWTFPALSLGQLVDLRKESSAMEGFFVTTDLSDWDPSYADRGFYLYVCIRFLNDLGLNEKLNRSAIPLLIQVSNDPQSPSAEALLLLHPQTKKSGGNSRFYQEEAQHFNLASSPILVKKEEYFILDSDFNSKGRLKSLSFLKKGIRLKSIERPVLLDPEENPNEEEAENIEESLDTENGDEEEIKKDWVLEVGGFAKQFSSSCESWPILNYSHSIDVPDYLKVDYNEQQSKPPLAEQETKDPGKSAHSFDSSSSPANIPKQTLIPESASYEPVKTS